MELYVVFKEVYRYVTKAHKILTQINPNEIDGA